MLILNKLILLHRPYTFDPEFSGIMVNESTENNGLPKVPNKGLFPPLLKHFLGEEADLYNPNDPTLHDLLIDNNGKPLGINDPRFNDRLKNLLITMYVAQTLPKWITNDRTSGADNLGPIGNEKAKDIIKGLEEGTITLELAIQQIQNLIEEQDLE